MKKAIEIYVSIVNKFVDLLCKLFKKQEGFCNFLNNKTVRKVMPFVLFFSVIGFIALVAYLVYIIKFKKKK